MPEQKTMSLREAMKAQVEVVIQKAEHKGKGLFVNPPLDLDAIRVRSEELDPRSQTKADIWMLLAEVNRLRSIDESR